MRNIHPIGFRCLRNPIPFAGKSKIHHEKFNAWEKEMKLFNYKRTEKYRDEEWKRERGRKEKMSFK